MANNSAEAGHSQAFVPSAHADEYSNMSSYFSGNYDKGHLPYSLGHSEKIRLGDVTSSTYDREHYAPFIAGYIAERAVAGKSESETAIVASEYGIVTAALTQLYDLRRADLKSFRQKQAEFTKQAQTIARDSQFVEAALQIGARLNKGDYEVAVITSDIVSAIGIAASQGQLPIAVANNVSVLPLSERESAASPDAAEQLRDIA